MIRQRATRLTSAPFRAQAPTPGMQPVIRRRPSLEGPVMCLRLPVVFRPPPFASWPSCPATGFRLPCGRPTGRWSLPPDLTGFPCFALVSCDRCRAPPLPRDRGALMADYSTSATTAASQRRALFPGVASISRGLRSRGLRGFTIFALPAFPLPVTSGWNTGPWASSRASHPAVTSDACQERERALSTHSELTVEHSRPSISVTSLTTGEVDPERGADLADGPFLRVASRTRRAPLNAPGSPQAPKGGVLPQVVLGHGVEMRAPR